MKPLKQLLRTNIKDYITASCSESKILQNNFGVRLSLNESPYNIPYNRFPDTDCKTLKESLSKVKRVAENCICVCNGMHGLVDVLCKCFCDPGVDNIVGVEPSLNVMKKMAGLNGVEYKTVLLNEDFSLNVERIISACDDHTKLIYLSSPNNPTGNLFDVNQVIALLNLFDGMVIVDETYADYNRMPSWRQVIGRFSNLITLDNMNHAWGCAAANVAVAYSNSNVIDVLNIVVPPYSVNSLAQQIVLQRLSDSFEVEKWVSTIVMERQRMLAAFRQLPLCDKAFASEANFFLARFHDVDSVYTCLLDNDIYVHRCDDLTMLDGCLRITIGSKNDNNELLSTLRS